MKLEVVGSLSLEDAVASTLSKRMDTLAVHVTNAAQAYSVTEVNGRKLGCAFYLTIGEQKLYLVGGIENTLSPVDSKRLCAIPERMLDMLDDHPAANNAWRNNCRSYIKGHSNHLFRGAVLHSDTPPDIYHEGKVKTVIVTHPASQSAFDLEGRSLFLPKEMRKFYTIQNPPMVDGKYTQPLRSNPDSVIETAQIMAKNLQFKYAGDQLQGYLLQQAKTPPILMITRSGAEAQPIAMSKEASTFEFFDRWGQVHNRNLGITGDFVLQNSHHVAYHLDSAKVESLKAQMAAQAEFSSPSM